MGNQYECSLFELCPEYSYDIDDLRASFSPKVQLWLGHFPNPPLLEETEYSFTYLVSDVDSVLVATEAVLRVAKEW